MEKLRQVRQWYCQECDEIHQEGQTCSSFDDKRKVDKFLMEAMGFTVFNQVRKKNKSSELEIRYVYVRGDEPAGHTNRPHLLIDFSTWLAFGKLWEWAIEQDWWDSFAFSCEGGYASYPLSSYNIPDELINPEAFAKAIYNYLKERE